MLDAILSLIPGGGITALFAGLAAFLAWSIGVFMKGRSLGKDAERAKQAGRDLKAKDERLEMHREADEIEREAARLSDEEAKRKAMEWARKN